MLTPFHNSPSPAPAPVPGPVPGPISRIEQCRGQFFRYALPSGWRAQENSNMLCLTSPDGGASIMMVGLAGLFQPLSPDQFLFYLLNAQGIHSIRIFSGQSVQPAPGCAAAGVFELEYVCNGAACRGVASSHVAVGYNQCNGAVTLAASRRELWPRFANWLPNAASFVAPAGSQTFMVGAIAAQSLRDSVALGQKFQEVNQYVQNSQQETTNMRWRSDEVNNFHFRENLGNVVTYANPFAGRTVELTTQYTHYWVNRQGDVFGTNNPSDDPRMGSSEEWVPMPRYRP